MITSKDNSKLTTIRRLVRDKSARAKAGLFVAEGEDLVAAADALGWRPEFVLEAGVDVEPELLHAVSSLGSGARVIGVYPIRWARPAGDLSVYLHAVGDPGNVGTIIRSAHAFADGPVMLGPACADPFSPKAVRASMGSVFARPPARVAFAELSGTTIALQSDAGRELREIVAEPPVVLCVGAERDGLPAEIAGLADAAGRIRLRPDGPDSLNVAMAATVALYERTRMADHA